MVGACGRRPEIERRRTSHGRRRDRRRVLGATVSRARSSSVQVQRRAEVIAEAPLRSIQVTARLRRGSIVGLSVSRRGPRGPPLDAPRPTVESADATAGSAPPTTGEIAGTATVDAGAPSASIAAPAQASVRRSGPIPRRLLAQRPECTPPFVVIDGIKRYKPECL